MSDEQSEPFFPAEHDPAATEAERDRNQHTPPAAQHWGPPTAGSAVGGQGYGQPADTTAYGQPQYGQPQFDQSQPGQPQYEQPQYGQPQYEQPQYGQPQYGQPQYGQPQYGQPQYGQPQYGQPMQPGPPGYPVPPSHKRRTIAIIIGVVAALVAAAVVIVAVAYNKSGTPAGPKRTLAIPATSGRYTLQTGPTADQVAATIAQQLSTSAELKNAKVGVYGLRNRTTPALILLGLSAQGNPDFARELRARSATAEAKTVFDGAHATSINRYPAGPLGGVLECATIATTATRVPLCVWVDKSTLGVTVATAGQTETGLAADSLQLRNDAEH